MRAIFHYGPQPKSHSLHKKGSFPLRIYLVNVNISEKKTADLCTFTREILNRKSPFLCSEF